ncbi:MAG: glycosyl hydrolase 115 family protein [Saccharofermentans sp.]|nr:glycosyl hydrolase 115 family protein [Saccharofermentans sp.]
MGSTEFFRKGRKIAIVTDGSDKGILRVASIVIKDIERVTDSLRKVCRIAVTDDITSGKTAYADTLVFAGILTGSSDSLTDRLLAKTNVDPSDILGKKEVYAFAEVTGFEGLENKKVFVIAGSDKLGTIYGLYKLSEMIGVSPWHYFADVKPIVREEIAFGPDELPAVSHEPKIEYRGFFLNDDWPSLGGWVTNAFDDFNELFYEKVFDLLLRLRGNFMWPAMWSAVFNNDGKAFPEASAVLADELGITMGTSHHEPLIRAGEEFSHMMTDSNDIGYGKDWSYYTNPRGLYEFWTDSIKARGKYKNLITVGMRGERDSKILGEDATMKDNIDLLKKTITDQKKILAENGLEGCPKVLALYKEVEDYYYGDDTAEGLCKWEGLDDLTLLLSDDNFGNLRTVPSPELKDRKAGWGIYYHFDYHGDPISYEWVNSTPITKAWEQLTSAYEYGIRKLWICNVGDLRPVELPLNYFMDLAFDFDYWQQPNKTSEYLTKWVKQQFAELDEPTCRSIENLLNDYINMNGRRRPEATHPDTFDVPSNLAFEELRCADRIIRDASAVKNAIPGDLYDKFYGLVYFPAVASANLRRMMVLTGLYNIVTNTGFIVSNYFAEEINKTVDRDIELVRFYNEEMSGGKWKYMMSSKHVNFQHWNDEGSEYPKPVIKPFASAEERAWVIIERSEKFFDGECMLPDMTTADTSPKEIYILNESQRLDPFDLEYDKSLLKIDKTDISEGSYRLDILPLGKVCETSVEVRFLSHKVTVKVRVIDTASMSELPCMVAGHLSMSCDSYASKTEPEDSSLLTIDNYGLSGKAVKAYPLTRDYSEESAPSMKYDFFLPEEGEYEVSVFVAPSNNTFKNQNLHFGLNMDGMGIKKTALFPEGYMAGYGTDPDWCEAVLRNCRELKTVFELSSGSHSLEYVVLDSMVVLQKIEIRKL